MATNINIPKLVIPTGFENQQVEIERKRRIADAMLARGLAPQGDMRHWAQLLGQMAQGWAGKSMQRGADRQQQGLNDDIRGAYEGKLTAFSMDENRMKSGEMSLEEFIQKYRSDPMLEMALEPHLQAYAARATANQSVDLENMIDPATGQLRTVGVTGAGEIRPDVGGGFRKPNTNMRDVNGIAMDLSTLEGGTVLPNDPNALLVRGSNGAITPNAPAISATRLSQGFGGSLPTSIPDPALATPTPPPTGGPMPPGNTITLDEAERIRQSMGDDNRFAGWLQQNGIKITDGSQ